MFIFLTYFIMNMILIGARVTIQNSGVMPIENDDTAMVFFVTLRNSCKRDVNVSVHMVKCIDNSVGPASSMLLIGGNMGVIKRESLRNVTLIYPNLYFDGRSGQCTVQVCYQMGNFESQIKQDIEFDISSSSNSSNDSNSQIDCVVKYSGKLSYYDRHQKTCIPVEKCPFDYIYSPTSNKCRNINSPVCKTDLETLEGGTYPVCPLGGAEIVNFMCHHGRIDTKSGECVCDDGWTTTSCSEGIYQPSLSLYHMCNIQTSSWGKANKKKVAMTVIAIIIFALMLAAKMLIAVCILNWCCHWISARRHKNENDDDEEICDLYTCTENRFCGDERCFVARLKGSTDSSPAETEQDDDKEAEISCHSKRSGAKEAGPSYHSRRSEGGTSYHSRSSPSSARNGTSTGPDLDESSEPTTERTRSRRASRCRCRDSNHSLHINIFEYCSSL